MRLFSHSLVVLSLVVVTACVSSGTHEAVVAELDQTKQALEAQRTTCTQQTTQLTDKNKQCDSSLTTALDQNQQLVTKVSSMGQNVEQLLGEKGELSKERERLASEQASLAREVEELKRLRAAAEARNAEYRKVMDKLKRMIDAGTLQVKVRSGRMIVQMSSDVVFPPGGTRIKPDAKQAINELAQTIAQFPDRKFQVIGHSDATPINTERFPSNWELSSQRAIEVVRVMVEAGVPAAMLSAAGQAEFDPLTPNDTKDNMAMNRRVEIIFMPKLSELPGFEATGGATASN